MCFAEWHLCTAWSRTGNENLFVRVNEFPGKLECPLYPTELAFALDVSQGTSSQSFSAMRDTVLRLVRDITISESNCPRGARVALTLYNDEVTTEVRFADGLKKRALLQHIEGLQTLQTNKGRRLDNAMSFVAHSTFKRVRSGFLMRKVAIFFVGGSAGQTQALTSAALRLHDSGIATLFLVNREDKALARTLQVKTRKEKKTCSFVVPGFAEPAPPRLQITSPCWSFSSYRSITLHWAR